MRLFVAIRFEEAAANQFHTVVRRLWQQAVKGNFAHRQNLHLTLAFLGETPRFAEAKEATLAVRARPFTLTFRGLGRFQKPGGDIWWIGAESSPALCALQQALTNELSARGFRLEDRPFRPHLTLGRQVRTAPGFDREAFANSIAPVPVTVEAIALMESTRVDGLLTYRPLVTHPLSETEGESQ